MSIIQSDLYKAIRNRDGLSHEEAVDSITDFITDARQAKGLEDLESLMQDYFNLEPDYLDDILPLLW